MIYEDLPKEEKKRQRFLDNADKIFLQYGYSRISVDELAVKLGISKRTLYKYFESKEQLLIEVIERKQRNHIEQMDKILAEDVDFITKMRNTAEFVTDQISQISVSFLDDLERSLPKVYEMLMDKDRHQIKRVFADFLKIGVKEGVFRLDVPLDIVEGMYLNSVMNLLDAKYLIKSGHKPVDLYNWIIDILVHGIIEPDKKDEFCEIEKSKEGRDA